MVFASRALGANWWSRWTDDRSVEVWSKPLALIALIGVAAHARPGRSRASGRGSWWRWSARWPATCSSSTATSRFIPGLVAFLLAHIAYTVGLVVAPDWSWSGVRGCARCVALLAGTVGVQIVRAARRSKPMLGPAVTAYLLAISVMFCAAAATGNWFAIVGAALFVASDSVLGWRQFVGSARWMPVTIMVTYHLGQAGLVASLL